MLIQLVFVVMYYITHIYFTEMMRGKVQFTLLCPHEPDLKAFPIHPSRIALDHYVHSHWTFLTP